jgi:tRNA threonylcarbamoyladenosine biosynthesis protein TsaE
MSASDRLTWRVEGDAAMRRVGATLAAALPATAADATTVGLDGELGTGKTTLTSGLLSALGFPPPHRSPTYTLVEPYELGRRRVYHVDLYRLNDLRELEALGIRDWMTGGSVVIIEWAARRGAGAVPLDLHIELEHLPDHRAARGLSAVANTASGARLLAALASSVDPQLVRLSR